MHTRDWLRVGQLPGEVKVNMAVDMTNTCLRVCAEGIRAQFPEISEGELLEWLRERLDWASVGRRAEEVRYLSVGCD
ncbi:hypothetical protein COS86_05585 [Candidatus Bathyarchaeota archaeon CG07_land_8_20_14_0_80_47_9]|nr:MAG: hypothetical protein COS86_05585 [Candidatus Bathyarchaeota archaeon CG07_land_8_20_14_0_80_47_9]